MKDFFSLAMVIFFVTQAVAQTSSPNEYKKITLKSGDVLENVVIYKEDIAFVTFMTHAGLTRIPKSDLPDDIAKQLNFDPVAAKEEVEKENQKALELAQKTQLNNEAENIFLKHGVELKIGSISGTEIDGFFVYATLLGEAKGVFTPSYMISGAEGLGSWKTVREETSLGTIFIKGMSRADIQNAIKPIWACQIGATKTKESMRTGNGYSERSTSCPVYSIDKKEIMQFYAGK